MRNFLAVFVMAFIACNGLMISGVVAQNYQPNIDYEGIRQAQEMQTRTAALKKKTARLKKWHYAAPFIGLAFYGLLFFLGRHLKKSKKPGISGEEAQARAMSGALQGSGDPQVLGKRVFSALRFGNYMEYASLFPTQHETKQVLSAEKHAAYWSGPRQDENLRAVFESMREASANGQATLHQVVVGDMRQIKTPDQQTLSAVSGNQLQLKLNSGEDRAVSIGSFIKFPSGWKLFMPSKSA